MNIHLLFPIAISQTMLDPELSESEISILMSFDTRKNIDNEVSIDSYVLESAGLERLKNFCTQSINEYFQKVYNPSTDCELYITQSWVNYTKSGNKHHKHYHPNSFVSGVFYVSVNSQEDKIIFYSKDQSFFKIIPKSYTELNSESWWFAAQNNSLLLFPSSMHHEAGVVNQNKNIRVSLSFNTFIKGNLGFEQDKTELTLGETNWQKHLM